MEPRLLPASFMNGLISKSQIGALEELSATPYFNKLTDHLQDEEASWIAMVENPQAETTVPEPWMKNGDISETNKVARILKKMIIIKVLRSDRLLIAVN